MTTCEYCRGAGRVVERVEICPSCHGTGHAIEAGRTPTFDPPIRVRRATITEVSEVNHDGEPGAWCSIRFRYNVGDGLGGRADGYTTVGADDWPGAYWPPAVGDAIRVEERPTITLEARPRAGV